jgi:hypothetical protein
MHAPSRVRLVLALLAFVGLACTGSSDGNEGSDAPAAEGPPGVQISVIEEHARQFDEDLPERPAGSQQEFAAATYLTGHLQRAGYEVRLASVPFKDLVRSTNVVALPPGGEPVSAVVTVLYDTGSSTPPNGRDLGLFLEIARALRVRHADHHVEFVALGAEVTRESGGNLGSKILASELRDIEPTPPVIALLEVSSGGFRAPGPRGDELNRIALDLDIPPARPLTEPLLPVYRRATNVYVEAEVPYSIAAGGIEEVAEVVLHYLEGR